MTELAGSRGVRVLAQAKVNLRLKILAREASGFHQLETLFLRIALADVVRIRRTTGANTLDVSGADAALIGPVERNLAWRAALAYAAAANWDGGFTIEIEKHIPIGGGLGGGSADAAAVLRGMNALAPRPLGAAQLLGIAAGLGSDVPFLSSEAPYALAWGRGERLLPLPPLPERSMTLVVPPFGVNTADAYRWLSESRPSDFVPGSSALVLRELSSWDTVGGYAENDFEPVVLERFPALARMREALRTLDGPGIGMMSGSGSTLFSVAHGLAEGGQQPETALAALGGQVVTTRTSERVEPPSAIE